MKESAILQSAYISIVIQFLIGLIGIHGVFIPLLSKDAILNDIMLLEVIVQFIELSFYIWLIYHLSQMSFEVTYTRYFDWFISTPLMLLTTVFFMEYMNIAKYGKIVTIVDILRKDFFPLIKIVIGNFGMLLFGFLAEIRYLPRILGFVLGTIGFLYSFYTIYHEFVGTEYWNQVLFYFMFFIWALYGVAFLFPYVIKNVSYNYLDIFSKNFYGLFLYYIILTKHVT